MAVRDVNHDANVIAELDATCMSFPRRAMLPSAHQDYEIVIEVEAAGIEPDQL